MSRVARNSAVNRFKRERRESHRVACDACGWMAPERIREEMKDDLALMQAHHVIPIVCGGPDDVINLVLLCRNCHAIAHALGDGVYLPNGRWTGMAGTPTELVRLLKQTWRPPGMRMLPIRRPDLSLHLMQDA